MRTPRANRSNKLTNATILIGIVALFLTACGTPIEPTPTQPPDTAQPVTPTPYVDRRPTLPPSWTPTNTPTHTFTPTVTDTPTATATLTLDQICEGLTISILTLETEFTLSDSLPVFVQSDFADLVTVFTIIHLESQQEQAIAIPGSQPFIGQLRLALETGPGDYQWTANAYTNDYAGICERQGTFTLIPEPETTPEVTAETTPEATIVTQTPIIIIVTATPDRTMSPGSETTAEPTP